MDNRFADYGATARELTSALLVFALAVTAWIIVLLPNTLAQGVSTPGSSTQNTTTQKTVDIWQWLSANKDQLSALASLFGAGSLVFGAGSLGVAVSAFSRAQRLNQANAVYQAMKEARDLRLQDAPIPPSGRHSDIRLVGLYFFASIDQYRLTGLIDGRTWKIFENDLKSLTMDEDVQNWIDGKPGSPTTFPPISAFDPRFIAHLRWISRQPQ